MAIKSPFSGSPVNISLILPAALAAAPVAAQESTELPPGPAADVVAALVAGDNEAALASIDRVESLSGLPRLVTTPAAFVDLLSGCEVTSAQDNTRNERLPLFRVRFDCNGAPYEALLMGDPGSPYVTVAEFSDAERIEQLRSRPSIPPPAPPAPPTIRVQSNVPPPAPPARLVVPPPAPPPVGTAARAELDAAALDLCERIGAALVTGEIDREADWGAPNSRFMFGFYNPFHRTTIVEADDRGLPGLVGMLATARERLGTPRSFTCEQQTYSNVLRWDYGRDDRRAFAFITVPTSNIISVDMRYATREQVLEAQREYEQSQRR